MAFVVSRCPSARGQTPMRPIRGGTGSCYDARLESFNSPRRVAACWRPPRDAIFTERTWLRPAGPMVAGMRRHWLLAGQRRRGAMRKLFRLCRVPRRARQQPEVLPWRTRLKTQIGDRLFHRGECGVQQCSDEEAAEAAHSRSQPAPLPAAHPIRQISPVSREASPPPAKTTDLEMPKTDLSKPESKRPDLVME